MAKTCPRICDDCRRTCKQPIFAIVCNCPRYDSQRATETRKKVADRQQETVAAA